MFVVCFKCKKKVWREPHELQKSKSGKYFCSKSCQTFWRNKYFSGERHPNWKNGAGQEYRNFLFKSGRKSMCQICGLKDKRVLIAHHIDGLRRNNKVKNLAWLCRNCHYLIHNHNITIKL